MKRHGLSISTSLICNVVEGHGSSRYVCRGRLRNYGGREKSEVQHGDVVEIHYSSCLNGNFSEGRGGNGLYCRRSATKVGWSSGGRAVAINGPNWGICITVDATGQIQNRGANAGADLGLVFYEALSPTSFTHFRSPSILGRATAFHATARTFNGSPFSCVTPPVLLFHLRSSRRAVGNAVDVSVTNCKAVALSSVGVARVTARCSGNRS